MLFRSKHFGLGNKDSYHHGAVASLHRGMHNFHHLAADEMGHKHKWEPLGNPLDESTSLKENGYATSASLETANAHKDSHAAAQHNSTPDDHDIAARSHDMAMNAHMLAHHHAATPHEKAYHSHMAKHHEFLKGHHSDLFDKA